MGYGGGRKPIPSDLTDSKKTKTSSVDHATRQRVEKSIREKSPKLTCPKYLSPLAKKEFRKTIKIYKSLDVNILSDLDIPTIASYCQSVAIYQDKLHQYNFTAEKLRKYEDEVYDLNDLMDSVLEEDKKTEIRKKIINLNEQFDNASSRMDRALSVMNKQTRIMNSLAESLCITPVGRARMGILAVKKTEQNTKLNRLKRLKADD